MPAARIPDEVVYRPKWKIAFELLDRASLNGLRFSWLTFDAGYGMHSDLATGLDGRNVLYVGGSPSTSGWTRPLPVMLKEHACHSQTGHPRTFPRVKVLPGEMHKAKAAGSLTRRSPAFTSQPWTTFRVKDDFGGPVVWGQGNAVPADGREERGVPTWALSDHRQERALKEIKHFVSNAPKECAAPDAAQVAFTRWAVERCFEDAKVKLGLGHFEVRNYTSLMRHLI